MAKKKAVIADAEEPTEVKKKTPTKKAAAEVDADGNPVKKKRKTRKKKAEVARRKLFWGVFNNSAKQVATFEFNQKKAAEKKAQELSPEGKPPHFVQKVKKDILEMIEPEAIASEETAAPAKKKKTKKS
jgi:hypothetical protein